MEKLPDHLREFDDHKGMRDSVYNNALTALEQKFPIDDGKTRLELHDLSYGKKDYTLKEQKKALMTGQSLRAPIKGTWKLYDSETNELLEEKKGTVLKVPYYTDRGTIVNSGNDYAFVNQARLKPGVFTRTRTSGEHEAQFNVKQGTGKGFRLWMEPKTGVVRVNVGQSNVPAYALYKAAGVKDEELEQILGKELADTNRNKANAKHTDQIYKQFAGYSYDKELPEEEKAASIRELLAKSEVDPWMIEHNLGLANTSTITPGVLLRSTQKLLNINKGDEEEDDRDAPHSANVLSFDDFMEERIRLDAGQAVRSLHNKASFKRNLNHVGPDALKQHVDSLVLNSGLASPLEETNPMHILEQVNRLSKLGDGGLPSAEAVTAEARAVNPGQVGFVDLVAGPECHAYPRELEVDTDIGWVPAISVTLDTNILCKDGTFQKPSRVVQEHYEGTCYGIKNEYIKELVTPTHRRITPSGSVTAADSYETPLTYLTGRDRTGCYAVSPDDHFVEQINGQVWCLTVPQGEFYLKRAGSKPYWSGNSEKIGIDTRLAFKTFKGNDRQMYSEFLDSKGIKKYLKPEDLSGQVLAFPAQNTPLVFALKDGVTVKVPRSEVDYTIPSEAHMNTAALNVVPMNNGYMGSRAFYSAKYQSQFMPLVKGERPLVGVKMPDSDETFGEYYGKKVGAVTSDVAGTVTKIGKDFIEITDAAGNKTQKEMADNFAFNRITAISHKPSVVVGEKVKAGTMLAHSNFTDSKTGALNMGRNLRMVVLPDRKAKSFEDAYSISESASRNLAAERMYSYDVQQDKDTRIDRNKYISQFSQEYTKDQLGNMDDKGVVKVGTVLNYGDPLILATGPKMLSAEDARLGKLHKTLKHAVKDESRKWDHHTQGVVTDIEMTSRGAQVNVKTDTPLNVGDKLVNGFSSKGVIGSIKPDDEMPVNVRTGLPYEVVFNPMAVQSRVAPNQIVDMKLGKIAREKGIDYRLPVEAPEEGWDTYAKTELKKHGIADVEDVYDPITGKTITKVGDGVSYIQVFHHLADKKLGTRAAGQGGYDQNEQPGKGGKHSARRMGGLEVNALLAHGATENLKDVQLIRGAKNDDYWNALKLGRPLPAPKVPFVYDKFVNLLKASGINVDSKGSTTELASMTDADVDRLTKFEITNGTTVNNKDFSEQPGGLFDVTATGGLAGRNWGKVTLTEPVPNPVMAEPIRRVLGLTNKELRDTIGHVHKLDNGMTGGQGLKEALSKVDLKEQIDKVTHDITNLRGTDRDSAVKTLRYLTTLDRQKRSPADLMITKVPVIPPVFRPVSKIGSTTLVSDMNDLYRDLIETNNNIKGLQQHVGGQDLADEHMQRYDALSAVFGWGAAITPEGSAKGLKGAAKQIMGNVAKHGLFQSKVVGKPVEQVGSAVVTPDGDLDMDTVRIPDKSAWDLFNPYVTRKLVQRGYSPVKVREMIENKEAEAERVLDEEMTKRPVLINRAPSWHKYSLLAHHAKRSPDDTLHASPLIVSGYNLDFDRSLSLTKTTSCGIVC